MYTYNTQTHTYKQSHTHADKHIRTHINIYVQRMLSVHICMRNIRTHQKKHPQYTRMVKYYWHKETGSRCPLIKIDRCKDFGQGTQLASN